MGMRKSTLIGCRSELGGSPLASSIAVIPSDQMSAWQQQNKRVKMFTWIAKKKKYVKIERIVPALSLV